MPQLDPSALGRGVASVGEAALRARRQHQPPRQLESGLGVGGWARHGLDLDHAGGDEVVDETVETELLADRQLGGSDQCLLGTEAVLQYARRRQAARDGGDLADAIEAGGAASGGAAPGGRGDGSLDVDALAADEVTDGNRNPPPPRRRRALGATLSGSDEQAASSPSRV